MERVAAHGPIKTAAKAPPNKCPLVPAATGKLIIWAAKMKTVANPARGAVLSESSDLAPFSATPTPTALIPIKASEVGRSIKPSGICIGKGYCESFASAIFRVVIMTTLRQ
jgi:hypothetical protein